MVLWAFSGIGLSTFCHLSLEFSYLVIREHLSMLLICICYCWPGRSPAAAVAAKLVSMWILLGHSVLRTLKAPTTKQMRNHGSCNFRETLHLWPVHQYVHRTSLSENLWQFSLQLLVFGHWMKVCLPLGGWEWKEDKGNANFHSPVYSECLA